MAITWQWGTQALLAGQDIAVAGVAFLGTPVPRHMSVLAATLKDSTATFTDPTGYTKIGEQAGGTGVAADDVGTTKVAAWYRILDGNETNEILIPNDGVTSAGGVAVYAPTDGRAFTAPIFVSGSDDTHGASFDPAGFGAWSSAVGPGDMLLAVFSTDTDEELSDTPGVITQTGITFVGGAVRVLSRSTTGFDCSVYVHERLVDSGTGTDAPAFTKSSFIESCGAAMLIRLHEEETGGGVILRQVIA